MATEKAHYVGMPQLDPAFMASQVFWLVVALVVLYFIMSRVAMPRIATIISERHEAISRDLDKAAELKIAAEVAEAAYQQALKDARAQAQKIAGETKANVQAELAGAIEKAEGEIAAKTGESEARIAEIRRSAVKNVEIVAKATAAEIVKALLPGAKDADVGAAVSARLKG